MKRFFAIIFVFFICLGASASDFKNLPYKNIKEGAKITVSESGAWSDRGRNKNQIYYTRNENRFCSNDESKTFDTGCEYLFIVNNKLIGYSNASMKYFEFLYKNDEIECKDLTPDEISTLFKDFKVITLSEFSNSTNVFKLKKKRSEEKILLVNDTFYNFDSYEFTTNNARFVKYNTNNAIGVTKKGLIQFSGSENAPWYILLVR